MKVPTLCGADIELGNFVLHPDGLDGTAPIASLAVLREMPDAVWAQPTQLRDQSSQWQAQDWGRRFLNSNGGCTYIDLDHLELCLPEVRSARDHVAAWHAMLRITRTALDAANRLMPAHNVIQLLANNSDGKGHSYGSHLNFLISAQTFANLFQRKMHHLLCLAAFQASSIVFTGQGKVGAENGAPDTAFQIAQRADFFATLTGPQTTYDRPLVNSRDEPLCGSLGGESNGAGLRRLHCIFYDNTLNHVATFLKVGSMQIFLAMLEAEQIDIRLILDDPIEAVRTWSHDPGLRSKARLASGGELTAVELQLRILENARSFVAAGGCSGLVPDAEEIVDLWEETLHQLADGEVAKLARRLDWVLKLSILHQAMMRRPDLTWSSPGIKQLDDLYSSLDATQGLYWLHERLGGVDRIVTEERIEHFVHQPPNDTRAWTRAMLLRAAPSGSIESIDWDALRFRVLDVDHWPQQWTVHLDNPLGFTEADIGDVFEDSHDLNEILDRLTSPLDPLSAAERGKLTSPLPVRGKGGQGG